MCVKTEGMSDHPLRRWRKASGITLVELAKDLSVVPATISQIETGKRTPSLPLAARLSEKTDIPLALFVPIEKAEAS